MTPENPDLMVHDLIGRLFEEPEPRHRADLADGAITHGVAVTRRRGFAVAGATLSVLAVVAGAFALAGGGAAGGSGDWSLGQDSAAKTSPQAYEDSNPTYADRQREIFQELPAVLDPLLPDGLKTVPDAMHVGGVTLAAIGDYEQGVELGAGGNDFALRFSSTDDAGYADAFARTSATPIAVSGGTIRVAMLPGAPVLKQPGFSAWYEFKPADASKPVFRIYLYGSGRNSPIDTAAFKKMVENPGFAKLQQLLDPSVPASAAAVQQRYALEAKINAEAKTVLPPGFRLKLNPGQPGGLELVGPDGVNTFQWDWDTDPSLNSAYCSPGTLCFAPHGQGYRRVGPDGEARLGVYEGQAGKSAGPAILLFVFGKPETGMSIDPTQMGKPVETAPQGPGLTPQQAMAIVRAPNVATVIADVNRLAALNPLGH